MTAVDGSDDFAALLFAPAAAASAFEEAPPMGAETEKVKPLDPDALDAFF